MCSGAREHQCWNSFSLNGPLAARLVSQRVFDEIEALAAFDPVFGFATEESRRFNGAWEVRRRELDAQIAQLDRELQNLLKFVRNGGDMPSVRGPPEHRSATATNSTR